jgi:16S rRNA (cytosine967-C5)-methyltransferase
VIRRHPDIKLLRRASDMGAFAALQLSILEALVPLLAPGGRLLYSTCSVLPAENDQVIGKLLAAQPQLRAVAPSLPLPPGTRVRPVGWQLLPGAEAGTDGFYYACIENTTVGT